MTKVQKISKVIATVTFICSVLIVGLFVWTIGMMGDRYCKIEIQNGGQGRLSIKTFQFTNYDKKLTIDSISLQREEKLEIGSCINCSTPNESDLHFFDSIGFHDNNGIFLVMDKNELIKYLETKDKEDCITYIIE